MSDNLSWRKEGIFGPPNNDETRNTDPPPPICWLHISGVKTMKMDQPLPLWKCKCAQNASACLYSCFFLVATVTVRHWGLAFVCGSRSPIHTHTHTHTHTHNYIKAVSSTVQGDNQGKLNLYKGKIIKASANIHLNKICGKQKEMESL